MNSIKIKLKKTRNSDFPSINLKTVKFKNEERPSVTQSNFYTSMSRETHSTSLSKTEANSMTKANENKIMVHPDRIKTGIAKTERLRNALHTAELKINFEDVENQEELNKREILKREEFQVKKLNNWEIEKLHGNKDPKASANYVDHKSLTTNNEIENLNFLMNEKDNIARLNIKGSNQIQDLYKKTSAEQCSIFLQNINISKKKFNFDVFKNITSSNKNADGLLKISNYKVYTNSNEQKDSLRQDPNFINQLKQINIEIEGNLDTLANVDTYRNIIREKLKVENGYRRELTMLSQKMLELKLDKRRLEKINSNSIKELEKAKRDFEDFKDKIELQKKGLHAKFDEIYYNNIDDPKNHKKKTFSEEEIFVMRKDLQDHLEELDGDIQEYYDRFNRKNEKLTEIVKKNKQTIISHDKEIKQNKGFFNTLIKEQKIYYLEILKKGIDVRSEGLAWLVKRLIELNAVLDYSMFPRFLDHSQIDYLLRIESNQLKSILKILKEKQKAVREKEIHDRNMAKTRTSLFSFNQSYNSNTGGFLVSPNSTSTNFRKTKFSNMTMRAFDSILLKYNFMIKKDFEHKIEDVQMQKVLEDLKVKLKGYISSQNSEDLLMIEKHEKEFFNDILTVRENIQKLEEEIEKMKKDEMTLFKRKYDSFRTNVKFNIQHDMIFAALFGNNIIV